MELPQTMRETLVEELDSYLEAIGSPDAEQVTNYVLELLETAADEHDLPRAHLRKLFHDPQGLLGGQLFRAGLSGSRPAMPTG